MMRCSAKESEKCASYKICTKIAPTVSVEYDIIKKKELFTVDFKRPASGFGDIKLGYGPQSDGQFFSSVGYETNDTSITDIAALVKEVTKAIPALKAIADEDKKKKLNQAKSLKLFAITETVAIEYFDIREPNLEGRIQEFLDRHVNLCGEKCPTPAPPPQVLPSSELPGTLPAPTQPYWPPAQTQPTRSSPKRLQ